MATRRKTFQLTPFATEFLETNKASLVVVHEFDRWLKASFRPIRQLDVAEIEQFLRRLSKTAEGKKSRIQKRTLALKYFD